MINKKFRNALWLAYSVPSFAGCAYESGDTGWRIMFVGFAVLNLILAVIVAAAGLDEC